MCKHGRARGSVRTGQEEDPVALVPSLGRSVRRWMDRPKETGNRTKLNLLREGRLSGDRQSHDPKNSAVYVSYGDINICMFAQLGLFVLN